ncbi:MAG: NAD-dependent epimerase/dehydratase family protein [Bacteroidota bacterium]
MEKKHILVTGGAGRLGNVLVRQLLEQGHTVRVLVENTTEKPVSLQGLDVELMEGDIRKIETLQPAILDIDVIFHLAAKISLYPDKDGSVWAINVEGTKNIASLALEHPIERFIHCSSHHAVDKHPYTSPMDETRPLAFHDKTGYHRSKAHAEKVILDLIEQGLPAVIVNPGTVIGPHDYEPSILGQALIDLSSGKLPVIMEGLSDYADARDIASGMIAAMHKGRIGERYFLTGHLLNMKELSAMIGKVTGAKTPKTILPLWLMYALLPLIQFTAWLKGEKPLFTKDMLYAAQSNPVVLHEKAKQELGFTPRPLDVAFRDTMDFLLLRKNEE